MIQSVYLCGKLKEGCAMDLKKIDFWQQEARIVDWTAQGTLFTILLTHDTTSALPA
jgi:hypothetical protein